MRRITIFMVLLVSIILPLLAAEDVYSYEGSSQAYSTAATSFTASIDKGTWLKKSASSSDSSYVYYGFYTDSSKGSLTPDADNSDTPTLVFKEEMIESVSGDSYQATAKFTVFFYIISNSSYKATLTWSDLTAETSVTGAESSLTVSMNNDSSKSLVLKGVDNGNLFNPANGIYQPIERTIEATTQTYSLADVASTVVYTGWMKLTLETVS